MDGAFVFQRRASGREWSDFTRLPLSKLKADEWVKIDLKAAELLSLFQRLESYYALVREHGITPGTREFIPAPQSRALALL